MIDKIQKIRKEIERRVELHAESNDPLAPAYVSEDNAILFFIDSMQEEPVSEDLEKMSYRSALDLINNPKFLPTTTFGELIPMLQKLYKDGAQWQKTKDESITDYLGDYINELSKQFPEVSFAKLGRIAVRVAKWQEAKDQETIETAIHHAYYNGKLEMKEQMMANAIDAKIGSFTNGTIYDVDFNIDSNLKDNDKVKVIIIMED